MWGDIKGEPTIHVPVVCGPVHGQRFDPQPELTDRLVRSAVNDNGMEKDRSVALSAFHEGEQVVRFIRVFPVGILFPEIQHELLL